MLVAWLQTGSNQGKVLTIQIPRTLESAEQMAIADGPLEKVKWTQITPNSIRLKITESPIYLTIDKSKK